MSKEHTVNSGGIWLGILGIILVVCKILEVGVVASWSWWLVLLPFYLGVAVLAVILLIGVFTLSVAYLVESWRNKR